METKRPKAKRYRPIIALTSYHILSLSIALGTSIPYQLFGLIFLLINGIASPEKRSPVKKSNTKLIGILM